MVLPVPFGSAGQPTMVEYTCSRNASGIPSGISGHAFPIEFTKRDLPPQIAFNALTPDPLQL